MVVDLVGLRLDYGLILAFVPYQITFENPQSDALLSVSLLICLYEPLLIEIQRTSGHSML